MGSLEDRLGRLEASLAPTRADTGARERFSAKLAAVSERHCANRERGEEPVLEAQSFASLLGLVESYPYGEVPAEVAQAVRERAGALSHGPESVFAKVACLSLRSRGAA